MGFYPLKRGRGPPKSKTNCSLFSPNDHYKEILSFVFLCRGLDGWLLYGKERVRVNTVATRRFCTCASNKTKLLSACVVTAKAMHQIKLNEGISSSLYDVELREISKN